MIGSQAVLHQGQNLAVNITQERGAGQNETEGNYESNNKL